MAIYPSSLCRPGSTSMMSLNLPATIDHSLADRARLQPMLTNRKIPLTSPGSPLCARAREATESSGKTRRKQRR
jgi:hypothetical protein